MPARFLATARFYGRFRYVGIGLFVAAACTAALTCGAIVTSDLPAKNLLLCMFALGTALGSFGAANDTALHAMLQGEASLSPEEAAELALERARRPQRLLALHASPKMALALPLVSLATTSLLLWRVLGAGAAGLPLAGPPS